jgi:hypothetical protein
MSFRSPKGSSKYSYRRMRGNERISLRKGEVHNIRVVENSIPKSSSSFATILLIHPEVSWVYIPFAEIRTFMVTFVHGTELFPFSRASRISVILCTWFTLYSLLCVDLSCNLTLLHTSVNRPLALYYIHWSCFLT